MPMIRNLLIPFREVKEGDRLQLDNGKSVRAGSDAYRLGDDRYAIDGPGQMYQHDGDAMIKVTRVEKDNA